MEKIIDKNIFLSEEEILHLVKYMSLKSQGSGIAFYYIVGAIFMILALILGFTFSGISVFVIILLLILGLFLIFQPLIFIPLNIKKTAERIYKKQQPTNVIIGDGRVIDVPVYGQEPPYTEINIPISMLAGVEQTDEFIILNVDSVKTVVIPIKELTNDEYIRVIDAVGL